jgi:hypothetical protein
MNKVERVFRDKGINRGGAYVYPKLVAINFIRECRRFNIGVLGMDALILHENATEPSMANSIDFTASPYIENPPNDIWDAAITFLKERDDKYHFEIVSES